MTQQFLEYSAWLCLNSNAFRFDQAFIITGITQLLANDHIWRLKNMFNQFYPGAVASMDYTQKTLTINESIFRAYPADNPEAPRGKTDVFFILADEFDFHTRRVQEEIMSVLVPYRPKEDALIVLNSTTKNPHGLYVDMDKEWATFLDELNLAGKIRQQDLLLKDRDKPQYLQIIKENIKYRYFLLEFDYLWGLGKIYTQEEIDEVKEDPTFGGEFCLQYAGHLGNVFSPILVQETLALGEKFSLKSLPINQYTHHFWAIDPGWAKVTPFYAGEVLKEEGLVRIFHCKLFDKSTPEEVADYAFDFSQDYTNIWGIVDGADRGFVNTLKTKFEESDRWTWETKDKPISPQMNKVIPVNFGKDHKQMLEHLFTLVAGGHVAIPKEFDNLEIAMNTAQAQGWDLDKINSVNHDHLDCLRMLVKFVKFGAGS